MGYPQFQKSVLMIFTYCECCWDSFSVF